MNYSKSFISNVCLCVVIVQNIFCFASLIKHNISFFFFPVAVQFFSSSVYRIVCLRVRVNNRIKKDREKKERMLYTAYLHWERN